MRRVRPVTNGAGAKVAMGSRNFVLKGVGSWQVSEELAEPIVRLAKEGKVVPVQIEKPDRVLYWNRWSEHLTLDKRWSEYPSDDTTWRGYLTALGSEDPCREEIFDELELDYEEYVESAEAMEEETGLIVEDPYPEDYPDLDDDMSGDTDRYIAWLSLTNPSSHAFDYLSGLGLTTAKDQPDDALAVLELTEGASPGNEATYARCDRIEIVSGLQHRLVELGENTLVVLDESRRGRRP